MITFHQGHFRHLASDLANAGIAMLVPLATDAFREYEAARRANPTAAMWQKFSVVNVEERGGPLKLARVLGKGGCILSTIDGNSGTDGPQGDERRLEVNILGQRAQVKDGLIKLAALFGAPLLPLFAHTVDGKKVCHVGDVIDPGEPLRGADSDDFVQTALTILYAHFSDNVQKHPDEWSGADLFHQWRLPEEHEKQPFSMVEESLTKQLRRGKTLVLNLSRIIELRKDNHIIWTDARSLRGYRIPDEMIPLAMALGTSGIDETWFEHLSGDSYSRHWQFVCELGTHKAIILV